ncbi:MAG: replication restart helicase PriA [Candidatus Binatia bacterium]
MKGGEEKFAQIVIPSPLKEPLTYAIPPSLRDDLKIGMRVLVPLGNRKVIGVVVDFLSETPLREVREILDLLDEQPVLDASLLQLNHWISKYYLSPIGEVLATILPSSLRSAGQRIILARPGEFCVAGGLERKILEEMQKKRGKVTIKTLARRFPGGGFYRALHRLASMGAVEIRERLVPQRIKKIEAIQMGGKKPPGNSEKLSLTPEQETALNAIQERLRSGGFETFLLYGVTGSGKTEVYLRAMELVRKAHKRSLILIPEISLTPQLLDRLQDRFPGRIGVLHSALTSSERWAQWWHILAGNVDVVVGARSAVFASVPDLGLIVVDEEHDPSYKQEDGLRYHARDLAVVRGKLLGCPVLLGSATPAVESFENCRQGRYQLLELTHRVEQRSLPYVEAVDLRAEIRDGRRKTEEREKAIGHQSSVVGLFSSRLIEALQENYSRGQQSLIFLNRRGYASFLQCRLCGFVLRCSHCSVTMTFHLKQQSVFCHHCGFRRPVRDLCPGCGNLTLSRIGFGTEQVEQELLRLMPGARIARMDRDTTRKRGSQERLIRQWERGEIDVLVGTQMITKGHDVTGVTLVGAILADLSLNLPDFRAAERTFQLLSQVSGRAGRGKEPGKVIIQTYTPDHYAFQHVITHDYKGFFASEIEFRRALNYPPFSRLVQLRLEGTRAQEVEAKAKMLVKGLRDRHKRDGKILEKIEILGPAPAPIEKLRSRYRWQVLLKGEKGPALLEFANQAREILPPSRSTRLYIDVDPYNML